MTGEEANVIAWTILGEAAGEGRRGMEAVAHVIRNRSYSGRFPDNPAAVALQNGQFSTWNAITNGGNIPRARYPVGSALFQKARSIVDVVFGNRPGADPTRGATHYYSPQGMPGGNEPYWWRSEAPQGGFRIGNHIFAPKYESKQAPTPATRGGGTSPVGNYPTDRQMSVISRGAAQLPVIGPTGGPSLKVAPTPAQQSAALRASRTIYDPVTKQSRPTVSASDRVRAAGSAKLAQTTAAQTYAAQIGRSANRNTEFQRNEQQYVRASQAKPQATTTGRTTVAGFSVPAGRETTVATIPTTRTVAGFSYAGQEGARRAQTQFAQPRAQPAGSVNDKKDQARLGAGTGLEFVPTGPALSRDAVAARLAGQAVAGAVVGAIPKKVAPVPAVRPVPVAPVPMPRIQRAPVRPPLEILVEGANITQYITRPAAAPPPQPKSAVQQLREQGYSPSEAYDRANQNSRDRARENASNPVSSFHERATSSGGMWSAHD